jgi:hypothetical protein
MADADDLRTVAHFPTGPHAALARNRLLDAGIHAVVADEFAMTVDPLLGGAINFIKVQVRAADLERAAELLDLEAPAVDAAETDDPTPPDGDEESPESPGEVLVRYAVRAGVLGAVLCPLVPLLSVYSLVQLVRAALHPGPLPPRANRAWYATFAFDAFIIAIWAYFWLRPYAILPPVVDDGPN